MEVWSFIQDQLLGMKWLNGLIGAERTAFASPARRWGWTWADASAAACSFSSTTW